MFDLFPEFVESERDETQEDEYEEVDQEEIYVKPGDMFQLGEHTLLCGDSTKRDDVKKLMGNDTANMVFTDPPYNMDFQGSVSGDGTKSSGNQTPILNDNMSPEQFNVFLDSRMVNMKKVLNGAYYITFYRLGIDVILNACTKNNLSWKSLIIRYKPKFNLSNSDYKSIYEPIVYGRHGDHSFYGQKAANDIWNMRKNGKIPQTVISHTSTMFKIGNQLFEMKKINKKKQSDIYNIEEENQYISLQGDGDVRELEKTKLNDIHPTIKPVALVEKAILNSSKPDDIILDMFAGSGSTIIAAEKTKRKCKAIEYEPMYIQAIIKRYHKITNGKEIRCINRNLDISQIIDGLSKEEKSKEKGSEGSENRLEES